MTNRPLLPENSITTNKPTRGGYYLTPQALRRVKAAASFAGLGWQAIAARPATVEAFLERVEPDMRLAAQQTELAERAHDAGLTYWPTCMKEAT